jgi:SAM-dependent methyltransferase
MMTALTSAARRGLRKVARLATDPLGHRADAQAEARDARRAMSEQAEATHRKVLELETLLRFLRRKEYLAAIATGALDVPQLHTEHPIAVDSNDTLHPRGAKQDNSICLRFNQRLYQLFNRRPGLKVLDLGCAGGGLVRTLLDDGHFAVGLEGSDYPLLNQCGEWGTVPHHLFTCDITRPYTLTYQSTGQPIYFDVITAWEVMEHIPEERIAPLMTNIERHLAPGGWVLLSIATFLDWDPATGVVWHHTVEPRTWWEERFAALGFVSTNDHPFGPNDWLRGGGHGSHDWKSEDDMGFHLALRLQSDTGAPA